MGVAVTRSATDAVRARALPRRSRRLGPRVHSALMVQLGMVAAVLAVLELAPRLGWVNSVTLVPLSRMLSTLWQMTVSGTLWPNLGSTALAVFLAFALAVVTGLVGGYLLWRYKVALRMLNPYLTGYYAVPTFAFYPVLISIFGLNKAPIVLLGWAYAVVAVVVNTTAGLQHIPPTYFKVARVYRLGKLRAFWHIYLRAASPLIFNGVKLGFSYSIIGVIASEFLLSTRGLGWLVSYNYNNFGVASMYAAILLIVALAIFATAAISLVERCLKFKTRSLS